MTTVYFLKLSNNNIYKGRTDNLQQRLLQHKNGKVISTKYYRPLHLIGYETYI